MRSLAALALVQAPVVSGASEWVYANHGDTQANSQAQEETWGGLCVTGHEQSPINVETTSAVKTAMPLVTTHFDVSPSYVKNTGHGFQLFETKPEKHEWNNSTSSVDSIGGSKGYSVIGGSKYNFYQVHWHTPSENTVDGKSFPLEAHFVHQLDDASLHGSYHRLAVIGLLYELGDDSECNEFLDKFWGEFPTDKGSAPYSGDMLDFNSKLSEELKQGYYHWYGSLTTPPCTEGVSWNLLKKREKVCQRQVNMLRQSLHATQYGINFNNRVPQPLYHRVVAEMAPDADRTPVNDIVLDPLGNWVYGNVGDSEANKAAQTATWGGLCSTGHEQSPINVVTSEAQAASTPKITTHFDAEATYVKNTGHGFQLFETSPNKSSYNPSTGDLTVVNSSRSAKGYSMIAGDTFNFYQLHWHTPSENTVDGESFAMEVHFVHQLDDLALHGTLHRLAVIGLLYELGTDDECNSLLDEFWSVFPIEKGMASYSGDPFDLNAKLSEELKEGYYHWYGSLTTPPCTEGVSWNLLKRRQKVCPAQVERLASALNTTQYGIHYNNRVVQPLNHRVVTVTKPCGENCKDDDKEADSTIRWGLLSSCLVTALAVCSSFI